VFICDWHSPEGLEGVLSRFQNFFCELIVIRKEASCLVSKSDLDGTCKSGEVNNFLYLEVVLNVSQSVTQNETTFSVSVADFDGEAFATLNDIAWLLTLAINSIVSKSHGKDDVKLWFGRKNTMKSSNNST